MELKEFNWKEQDYWGKEVILLLLLEFVVVIGIIKVLFHLFLHSGFEMICMLVYYKELQ